METYQPAKAMRVLKVLHWGLMGGPIIFSVVATVVITSTGQAQLINLEEMLSFLPIGFGVVMIPASFLLFGSNLKERVDKDSQLSYKIAAYQTAHIIRMAMLEGVALFAIVGAFVTSTYANFVVLFFALLAMVLVSPSTYKLMEALKLTREEMEMLEGQ